MIELVIVLLLLSAETIFAQPTPTVTPSLINSLAIDTHESDNEQSIISDQTGSIVMIPGDPNWVPTEFEMPEEEVLSGCAYPPGYSFPSVCIEGESNEIVFHMDHHPQEVLDKIVMKQGKQGKYNKIPPGFVKKMQEEIGMTATPSYYYETEEQSEDALELTDPLR